MQQPLTSAEQDKLPFPKWWPTVAGALVGVLLRVVFYGDPSQTFSAMAASFIYLSPLAVGAVTVYLAERLRRRTWGYYLYASIAANAFFVLGTMVVMIEGAICVIIAFPLFAAVGMVGGVIMGAVCRLTNWPKHTAYSVVMLPLILGALEPPTGAPVRLKTIERSVTIEAPREVVWDQLMNVRDIRAEEVEDGIAFLIGVPPPISALTDSVEGQPVRRVSMGKHVYFDQIEAERREHEYIRWTQRFYPDSFPPGAFDQHVVMGGEYFDIDSISYSLQPDVAHPGGPATRLTLNMHYRVSTRFNWYADAVARLVLGNLEEVLLNVYRERSEASDA